MMNSRVGRRIVLILAALFVAGSSVRSAHAQALPTATGPGSYLAGGVGFSNFQTDYGRTHIGGITGYVDANLSWRFGIEGEARYLTIDKQSGTSEITYMAGPRISFRPKMIRPYVKVLGGQGTFNFPYGFAQGKYFVYAPGGGVEMEVGSRLNVRLVDFEYQKWPQFTYGSLSPYGITFGVSYKFFNSRSWGW